MDGHRQEPRVAVVVVNLNGAAVLDRCLEAVARQTAPPPRVIVVDNASSDGSADGLERRHPGVEVVRLEENLGFAAANNLAVARAQDCEWVALLNPDAFPEPRWLERLLAAAQARPEFSFFGSRLLRAGEPSVLDGTGDALHVGGMAWRRDHGAAALGTRLEPEEVFSPCAAAALYRREAWEAAGGLEEGYFCYFEDTDLSFRLRLAGHRCLYVPDAVVHHVGSAIAGVETDFTVYHSFRNLNWTWARNMPWPLALVYLPQLVLVNVLLLAAFVFRGRGGVILRAQRDALGGLPRVLGERRAVQRARRVSAWELRRAMARGPAGYVTTFGRAWERLFRGIGREGRVRAGHGRAPSPVVSRADPSTAGVAAMAGHAAVGRVPPGHGRPPSPDMAGTDASLLAARRVTRNVGFNFGAQVWLLVLAVVTTPLLVHELGLAEYGLYSLVVALVGYFAFLDLGLGFATIKYVSEYRGRGDDEAVARVVGTAIGVYLLLALVGGTAIALSAGFVVDRILDVPGGLTHTATLAVLLTALGFAINMPLSVFSAVPNALQRMEITNGLTVLFGTVTVAGTVGLLLAGYGLVAVLALTIAVSAIAAVTFAVVAARLLPGVSLQPRLHLPTARLLVGFGSLKFANQVATQTIYHLDKLLVAALVSVSAVAFYAVPVTIAQRIASLVGNVSAAFLPAASELHGRGDRRRFEELYLRSTKLVALIVLPTGSLLVVFADPILRFWLDAGFARESADVLRVLAVGYVVSALTTMPALACDSVGRPRVTTAFSLVSAALNVGLSVALIPAYGIMGASFAILVNSVLVAPVFLLYVHRRVVPLPLRDLWRKSLARPLLAAAASWPAMGVLLLVADNLGLLLVALLLGLAAFVLATLALSVYDATDKQVVRASLRPQSSLRATAQ